MTKSSLAIAALSLVAVRAACAQGMPQALLTAERLHPPLAIFEPNGPFAGPFEWIGDLFATSHAARALVAPDRAAVVPPRPQNGKS